MATITTIISGDYVKTLPLKDSIHEEKDNGHT
jgi:hypothetical protein